MTREEILAKAKYIQFPYKDLHFNDYGVDGVIRMDMHPEDFYGTWKLNGHHFSPMVHFKKTMPVLAKLLDFHFNKDDFLFKEQQFEGYDLTMPYPKAPYTYEAKSLSEDNRIYPILTYDELTSCDGKADSPYHNLYRFYHDASVITNRNTNVKRNLFISGDSHLIPVVPMLSVYFKTIAYIDNRKGVPIYDKIKDIDFTDVLIELFHNPLSAYTDKNLR